MNLTIIQCGESGYLLAIKVKSLSVEGQGFGPVIKAGYKEFEVNKMTDDIKEYQEKWRCHAHIYRLPRRVLRKAGFRKITNEMV
jgi:hypothetical protein